MSAKLLFQFFIVLSFASVAFAATDSADVKVPDIKDLPRLQAGLAPGTIAWATPDQLHPTQPQTGHREVRRKAKRFIGMLKKDGKKFSQELYEFSFQNSVSPVYIGKTPEKDNRSGELPVLGYVTDRTHGSDAQSRMIDKTYGKKAYREPILDEQGRPLNFVLVKVMGDKSELSENEFSKFMVQSKNCYLKLWKRGKHGETLIQDIEFSDLPETVYETTDNPYRGLIGALQHDGKLGRASTDFSQFVDAEGLVKKNIVTWDEIDMDASDKAFDKAESRAAKFFSSSRADGLPGVAAKVISCDHVL